MSWHLAFRIPDELAEGMSATMFSRAIRKALAISPRSLDKAVRSLAVHFDLAMIAANIHHKVLGND